MTDIVNTAQKLTQDYFAALKALEPNLESGLKELFKKAAETHGNIYKIRVLAYTPYFNDGDECVFTLHDPEFYVNKDTQEESEEAFYDYDSEWAYKDPTDLYSKLNKLEPVIRGVYGDHIEMIYTASTDTLTVNECDHE